MVEGVHQNQSAKACRGTHGDERPQAGWKESPQEAEEKAEEQTRRTKTEIVIATTDRHRQVQMKVNNEI